MRSVPRVRYKKLLEREGGGVMGVEYFVCCDTCKVYYHLGKNLREAVPTAIFDFIGCHEKHAIWWDHDCMTETPVFCMPEYTEVGQTFRRMRK